jgi:hypothetical protein
MPEATEPSSEIPSRPDLEFTAADGVPEEWDDVLNVLLPSLVALAKKMAIDGVPVPEVEHYLEGGDAVLDASRRFVFSASRSIALDALPPALERLFIASR